MIVHQVFAIVHEEIVQNIIVCDNYELANQLARGTYGNEAIAVDCLQYRCFKDCKYKDGKFYDLEDKEIPYVPTQEQQVATLQQMNKILYKVAKLSAQNFTDEQAVEVPELYPMWTEGVEYKQGDRVTNEYGELYKATVTHVASSSDKEEIGEETAVTDSNENQNEGIALMSLEDSAYDEEPTLPTTSKWIKLSKNNSKTA